MRLDASGTRFPKKGAASSGDRTASAALVFFALFLVLADIDSFTSMAGLSSRLVCSDFLYYVKEGHPSDATTHG